MFIPSSCSSPARLDVDLPVGHTVEIERDFLQRIGLTAADARDVVEVAVAWRLFSLVYGEAGDSGSSC